jgi:hypothetical protein
LSGLAAFGATRGHSWGSMQKQCSNANFQLLQCVKASLNKGLRP